VHQPALAPGFKVAVLGLGNPVRSDDAVGLRVAAEIEQRLAAAPLPGVSVLSSSRAGFELIDLLAGFTHAVIVDCLGVPNPEAGRVRVLKLGEVAGASHLCGSHEISVAEAFELARRLGIAMPGKVELLGVEGGDTTTLSEELSPPVAAAVGPVARAVMRIVRTWVRESRGLDAPRQRGGYCDGVSGLPPSL